MTRTHKTLLIDADFLIYQSALAVEHDIQWDEDTWTVWADFLDAKAAFQTSFDGLMGTIGPGDPVLCLTDSEPSFRKDIWPEYKAGRKRRPLLYKPLREWVLDQDTGFTTYLRPRLEADDILGILGTHPKLVVGPKALISPDKDLAQIPGIHINHTSGEEWEVTPEEGEYFFYTQVLTGDSVDNYPGCPGIGPKRSSGIIGELDDWAAGMIKGSDVWPRIVKAYAKAGLDEQDAITQARCAKIIQHSDYNFKAKEPILWNPPSS